MVKISKPLKITALAAVGVSLVALPVLAFSSTTYQQQATKYVNDHCKAKISDQAALRCFLYARTQELGQSVAGLQGDVSGIKTTNANQDVSITNLNQGVATLNNQVAALGTKPQIKQFRNTALIPVGQPLVLTSSCPEGWTLTGGGGYFAANGEQPHGEVLLETSHPLYEGFTDSPNTWHVAGQPVGTLTDPTTAEAVAICMK